MKEKFSSLLELLDYFTDEKICNDYLILDRWEGTPICPHCATMEVYICKEYLFSCKSCKMQFTAKVGTIFESSKIPLRKWYAAIYLTSEHKNGISSHQLAKDIGVTQKSAWFMLQRIRFGIDEVDELDGEIELDETFVGGKNKNRHANKKIKNSQGRSFKDKTPILGMMQKEIKIIEYRPNKLNHNFKLLKEKIILQVSKVKLKVIKSTSSENIQPEIIKNINKNSKIISDEWIGYNGLNSMFNHIIIDHSKYQYVNENGNTTNTIEGFWTFVKRACISTHHYVSRKHLQLYANEIGFRYNNIKSTTRQKLKEILKSNKRITYKKLVYG